MNEIEIANELAVLIEQQVNGIDNSKKLKKLKEVAETNNPILYKLAYEKAIMNTVVSNAVELVSSKSTAEYINRILNSFDGTNYKLIEVSGDSMVGIGIEDGDYCVMDYSKIPQQYETVIAKYKGKTFVKKYHTISDNIILKSANANYPDIEIIDYDSFKMLGVVVTVLKNS